jgi:hypothetical protein
VLGRKKANASQVWHDFYVCWEMKGKRAVKTSKLLSKLVLFFALSMMVSSATISYFFVRYNEPFIASLRLEAQSKQALIRDVWNNIIKKESRADIAILLSILPVKPRTDLQVVKRNYLLDFAELSEKSTAEEIIKAVKNESKQSGEYIDNLYLEQIKVQNKIAEIEAKNKLYSDIAFFLQILSLVLIILRKDFLEQ